MTTKKATTKKVATKKAAPKKVVTKTTAAKAPAKKVVRSKANTRKRMLVTAPDAHSFWTTDGQVLNDLVSLMNALAAMEKDVFQYHVATDRHDFADWVEAVLDDMSCAADLRKTKTPKSAHTVVVRHLKLYQI